MLYFRSITISLNTLLGKALHIIANFMNLSFLQSGSGGSIWSAWESICNQSLYECQVPHGVSVDVFARQERLGNRLAQ